MDTINLFLGDILLLGLGTFAGSLATYLIMRRIKSRGGSSGASGGTCAA